MKPIRLLVALVALIGLSACYTSDNALVSDDDAATPFEKITFLGKPGEAKPDDKPIAFAREGKAYLTKGDSGDMWLRLKPVEGDFYVAQLSGEGDGKTEYLYGYIRIDAAAKVADVWRSVGTKEDARPGLRECKDAVCIDDLAAYIAYAKEAVAAGSAPDSSFVIEVE
jgi:hypothetical protein